MGLSGSAASLRGNSGYPQQLAQILIANPPDLFMHRCTGFQFDLELALKQRGILPCIM